MKHIHTYRHTNIWTSRAAVAAKNIFIRLPDVDQLGGLTKWTSGLDFIKYQNCYLLNFGWREEISLPQLVFDDDYDRKLNFEMIREAFEKNVKLWKWVHKNTNKDKIGIFLTQYQGFRPILSWF